ncbi:MAG: hypothetical protein WED34_11270 [Planctomycetales bacterium]
MRSRFLVLPLSAAVIAGLVAYRYAREDAPVSEVDLVERRLAPPSRMSALDGKELRLQGMLGRHVILLAFFDGHVPVTEEPLLALLRERHSDLHARNVEALAVSGAPLGRYKADLRAAAERGLPGSPPFRLLTDMRSGPGGIVIEGETHAEWGVPELLKSRPLPIVFLIDRGGRVPYGDDRPKPLDEPESAIRRLALGEDA